MSDSKELDRDLAYVRGVVEGADAPCGPAGIYLFWAAATLVGFALIDVRPEIVGTYWMIVFPVGWVFSGWLAHRHGKRVGQDDWRLGLRHAVHWLVMFVFVGLAVLLPTRGLIPWPSLGPTVLLSVALAYVLAGIHLDRLLLWPGVLMAGGYVVLLFEPAFSWTLVGAMVAAGLVVSALAGRRGGPSQATAA